MSSSESDYESDQDRLFASDSEDQSVHEANCKSESESDGEEARMDALAYERDLKFKSRSKRLEEIGIDTVSEQEPQAITPPETPILVSSEPEACPMEVRKEQLRQTPILLSNLPDDEFIWDGKSNCPMPKPIKFIYASGLDSAQAQQLLQTRFSAINDALVVNVTRNISTKLKDELSARLHTWWNDRTMEVYEDSVMRTNWFYGLRKLVRTCMGADLYKAVGLADLEKNLKRIGRQLRVSQEACTEVAKKRQFYELYSELAGEVGDSEYSDEVYPVEGNVSAIGDILKSLANGAPEMLVLHAPTLKYICKQLNYLKHVHHRVILGAPDVDVSELPGTLRLTTKARCVIRLKELLGEQLSEQNYKEWWATSGHCFSRTRERYAVLQGLPGLVELFIQKARLEQTIKVVNNQGDCYCWNETKRIWNESSADQLICVFLHFCKRIVSDEESNLHLESIQNLIKRTKPTGEEEFINDPMLDTMLKRARKHSDKLSDGTFAPTYRKMLVVGLKDHTFADTVNMDAPDAFPIRGGLLLNMRTGEVRPRVSTDHFTFESPASFRRNLNGYKNAETFLLRLCGGAPPGKEHELHPERSSMTIESLQKRAYGMLKSLQIHLGYLLTGEWSEKKFLQHYGLTDTGKSTLWGLFKTMLADFHTAISPALITEMTRERNGHEHTAGFVPLFGKRVITVEEVPAGTIINETLMKLFSSGGLDCMPVRGCAAKETRLLNLKFKIILVLNEKVKFAENVNPATVKRSGIYAYQTQFDRSSEQCKALAKIINTQDFLDELFSYCVEGSFKWYELGETPSCDIVDEATQEYQHAESPMDAFLHEQCIIMLKTNSENPPSIKKDDLRKACNEWFAAKIEAGRYEGGKINWPTMQDLKKLMTARGFQEKQVSEGGHKPYCFIGLRLKTTEEKLKEEEAKAAEKTPETNVDSRMISTI
jgi:hypothetical protein